MHRALGRVSDVLLLTCFVRPLLTYVVKESSSNEVEGLGGDRRSFGKTFFCFGLEPQDRLGFLDAYSIFIQSLYSSIGAASPHQSVGLYLLVASSTSLCWKSMDVSAARLLKRGSNDVHDGPKTHGSHADAMSCVFWPPN